LSTITFRSPQYGKEIKFPYKFTHDAVETYIRIASYVACPTLLGSLVTVVEVWDKYNAILIGLMNHYKSPNKTFEKSFSWIVQNFDNKAYLAILAAIQKEKLARSDDFYNHLADQRDFF
jgi:hypothetical protein